jgi:phosphoribosyl-AMP cyclohydrolase
MHQSSRSAGPAHARTPGRVGRRPSAAAGFTARARAATICRFELTRDALREKENPVEQLDQTISQLKYNDQGLIPAICVDAESGKVLMMAWMNADSLRDTVKSGKTHFWSRSRQKYWMKGESSGHTQEVKGIYTDCDADTLVIEVKQSGAACHEGYYSCFYRKLDDQGQWRTVDEKLFDPDKVYKK